MNFITKTTRLILIGLVLFSPKLNAQKTLKEAAEMSAKKFEKSVNFDRVGYGYLKTFMKQDQLSKEQLPELNEVALLTFLLFDASIQSRAASYQIEKDGIYQYITSGGGEKIINKIYEKALPGIKTGLGDKNLLTPEDYINSEDEVTAYQNAEIKPTGLINAANEVMGRKNDLAANSVPDDYVFHFATFASPDVKLSRSVGKLATDVDVESFLSVQISFQFEKKTIVLTDIKMALHVPNPAPFQEDYKYRGIGPTKGYWEGICLASLNYTPKNPIQVAAIKKKQLAEENYEGIDVVLNRITALMINYIDENLNELKEK